MGEFGKFYKIIDGKKVYGVKKYKHGKSGAYTLVYPRPKKKKQESTGSVKGY